MNFLKKIIPTRNIILLQPQLLELFKRGMKDIMIHDYKMKVEEKHEYK